MENFQTYLPYALAGILALAGLGKIVGVQTLKQEFKHWNLPNWVRILTGLVEVSTAALLLNSTTQIYGFWLTILLMTGAIALLTIASEYKRMLVPLLILGVTIFGLYLLGMPSFSKGLIIFSAISITLTNLLFGYPSTPKNKEGEEETLDSGVIVTHHFKETINSVKYHYVETGNPANETVVIIPGAPESWFAFHHIISGLAADYHIIALDLKPYGQTDKDLDGDHRFEHISKEIAALLDHLDIDQFHLMGHDRGTIAADHLVAIPTMNKHILKYVRMQQSFNEPHGEPVPPHHLMSSFFANMIYKLRWGMWLVYAKSAYTKLPIAKETIKRMDKEFKFKGLNLAMPLSFKTTSFDKELKDRHDFIFEKMTMPTLILQGKYDPGQHPEEYEDSGDFIRNGQVVFINAGHFFHIEHPKATLAAISKFLKEPVGNNSIHSRSMFKI